MSLALYSLSSEQFTILGPTLLFFLNVVSTGPRRSNHHLFIFVCLFCFSSLLSRSASHNFPTRVNTLSTHCPLITSLLQSLFHNFYANCIITFYPQISNSRFITKFWYTEVPIISSIICFPGRSWSRTGAKVVSGHKHYCSSSIRLPGPPLILQLHHRTTGLQMAGGFSITDTYQSCRSGCCWVKYFHLWIIWIMQ